MSQFTVLYRSSFYYLPVNIEDTSTSTDGMSWWSLKQETGRVFNELPRNLQSENPLEYILFSELVQRGQFSVLFTGSLG